MSTNIEMREVQERQFRRVAAVHPQWEGDLLLSDIDNTLRHESHGSRGTYRLSSGTLHIAWERFPAEDFVDINGLYVHESLARNLRQRQPDPMPQSGLTRAGGLHPFPIQVVSLRRTQGRRQQFVAMNPGVHFEFFDAVDGYAVDKTKFFDSPLADGDIPYTAGAVGCALSHLALWEKCAGAQRPMTIVEDDSVLRLDFPQKSLEVIARLPSDWDLIMWGWNFDSLLSINAMPGISSVVLLCDQAALRQSIRRFQVQLLEPRIFPLDKCFGTCAYSISPAGASKFRQNCFPLKNVSVRFPNIARKLPNNGIDIAMNRIYPMTNSYVSVPPLVITPNVNAESLTLTP